MEYPFPLPSLGEAAHDVDVILSYAADDVDIYVVLTVAAKREGRARPMERHMVIATFMLYQP